MTNYKSDIKLGEKYRDEQTGVEGVATAIYFFQHACERVQLERFNETKGSIEESVFDAPRLKNVKTEKVARATRPGGPARESQVRPSGGGR